MCYSNFFSFKKHHRDHLELGGPFTSSGLEESALDGDEVDTSD